MNNGIFPGGGKSLGVFPVKNELTYSSILRWDLAAGNVTELTLKGNVSRIILLPSIKYRTVGTHILLLRQDATGSRTVTWGSDFKWPAGSTPVLSTVANSLDILSFICDGSYLYGSYLRGVA